MDFGFAGFTAKPHLQLAALTGKGQIYALGTPEYISPDMLRGDRVDGRSDIYSVGIILYEMLTGRLPFQFEDQNTLLAAHAYEEPPRFATLGVANVPAGVEAVVALALAKFPIERQQRARDVAQMFGSAVGVDYWKLTQPEGWEPPSAQTPAVAPATRSSGDFKIPDPYQVNHEFNAFVPERLAAAKIRGFVDDLKGEVLESEPGLIRLRLGLPTVQDAPATGSTILSWFRSPKKMKPAVVPGQEPIELELMLDRPNPSETRLHVVVAFRPMKEHPPADAAVWRTRCDRVHAVLKQYMGGQ
jgi:serine/threonine protein kinase